MANRNLHLDILGLLLLCFLTIDAVAASPGLSKPNCRDHCGNIGIPYPFGMDRSECFLDPWYEIVCQNETTPIPLLKKVEYLKVLNISLPLYYYNSTDDYHYFPYGEVTVNYPIIYSNNTDCSINVTSPPGPPPSLKGSPFAFSWSTNYFNAVGCNAKAMMNTSDGSFVGCGLQCSAGEPFRRCRAKVSVILQTLAVDFSSNNPEDASVGTDDDKQCNYAFLATESWSFTNVDSLKMEGHTPVALTWAISNTSDLAKGLELDDREARTANYLCSSWQYDNDTRYMMDCACNLGYEGNPYLMGCQDVDECKDPEMNRCPDRCVNKPGRYDCEDPNKKLKLVMAVRTTLESRDDCRFISTNI